MMVEPFWEPAYRAHARPFGPPSEEILTLMERLPRRARVLDLGCGDDRNRSLSPAPATA